MGVAVATDRLRAESRGLGGGRCVILRGGEEVATLRTSTWRLRGELSVGGTEFSLRRTSLRGPFVLTRADAELARATKPSMFFRRFLVSLGDATFELKPAGFFARRFVLTRGGAQVGEIRKAGKLRFAADILLPAEWPLPLQLFVFWLVWNVWRQEAAAAAGG